MKTKTQAGGFYGWWLLFFLWFAYTMSIGVAFYSTVVLYPFMIAETGWARGEVMMGFTIIMLIMGFTAPLTAWMINRSGARTTMFIGGLIAAVASFLMGLYGHTYSVFLALSVPIGLGVSLASVLPVQTVAISWFNRRRALALGLVLGGGAIGGFLAPQLVSAVVTSAGGNWRIGWFIIAIASAIGAMVALLGVRNYPSDLGQHPDGLAADGAKAADAATTRASRTYRTTARWTVRSAVKTPALWFLIIAVSGSFFLWYMVLTQTPLHLRDRGFDPAMAAFFYSLALGLSIVGRFAIAAVGDIVEPRILFAIAVLCILLGGILFWFVSPSAMWIAYLYPFLAGFGFGAAYICIPTIIGNYWGTEAFAGINGLTTPITMVFEAIAAPLAGFLYDLQHTYFNILLIAWVGAAIGFTAMLLCKPPTPKEELRTAIILD